MRFIFLACALLSLGVWAGPCQQDLKRFCAALPAAKSHYCLLKHESKLGLACAKEIKQSKLGLLSKNPCLSETVNLCYTDVSGVKGSIIRCLIRNRKKLGPNCQRVVERKVEKFRKEGPCFDDLDRFCPYAVEIADIETCLEKKISSLAPQCKSLIQTNLKKAQANPCFRDAMRFCPDRSSPQELNQCMKTNFGKLSKTCATYIQRR